MIVYFRTFSYIICLLTLYSCSSSNRHHQAALIVKAYIKRIGLDSITKDDLFKEKFIQFTQSDIQISQAIAYFDKGESFNSVRTVTFAGNRISFLNLYSIVNAKAPFRVTIADIHYVDKKRKKGMAEEFNFIVY